MQKKIFFSIFLLCVFLTLILNATLLFLSKEWLNQNALIELEKHNQSIAPFLDNFKQKNKNNYPYRITIIQQDGKVIFDNSTDIEELNNHSDRIEIQQAFLNKKAHSIRYSQSLNNNFLYYATLIENQKQPIILRSAIMLKSLNGLVLQFLPYIFIEIILILCLCYFLAKFLTFKIIQPLQKNKLESILKKSPYKELNPFIEIIKNERKIIKTQLNHLKQKQNQIMLLAKNMSDSFILFDKDGKILLFNTQFKNYFPWIEKLENINLLNAECDNDFKERILFYLNQKQKNINKETIKINEDYLETCFCPIFIKKIFKGLVIILRDISKEIKMQKLRKEFSANVTHELKTPLTSILASAEMLNNQMVLKEDFPLFLNKIENEARHLLNMINDILNLSFMDENYDIKKEEINLKLCIEKVLQRLNILLKNKNIKLKTNLRNLNLNGNALLIENLIYNLIENAIKYNQQNGILIIRLYQNKENIVFSVQDSGIGIDKQFHTRIFERFWRANKEKGGTGLGLAIAKAVAKRHGGKIFLKSDLNQGSIFKVVFAPPKF